MILLSVSSDPALILFRKVANSGKTKQQLKSLLAEKKKERRHLPAHKTQVNLEQLYLTSLEKFCQYVPAEIQQEAGFPAVGYRPFSTVWYISINTGGSFENNCCYGLSYILV